MTDLSFVLTVQSFVNRHRASCPQAAIRFAAVAASPDCRVYRVRARCACGQRVEEQLRVSDLAAWLAAHPEAAKGAA